jgi:hypothetical protein
VGALDGECAGVASGLAKSSQLSRGRFRENLRAALARLEHRGIRDVVMNPWLTVRVASVGGNTSCRYFTRARLLAAQFPTNLQLTLPIVKTA